MDKENIKDYSKPVKNDLGKRIKTIPAPEPDIGIATENTLLDSVIAAEVTNELDISAIENFTNAAKTRDQVYQMLDTMCEDSSISAILETYVEDAVETNEDGKSVWVESANEDITKYVTYLLDTLNIEKNIYKWAHALCKYGDLYVRLYRESDIDDELFNSNNKDNKLNEEINLNIYKSDDNYTHYVEMVPNPAEIFELTKFGKTKGYIEAKIPTLGELKDNIYNKYYQYNFQQQDVNIYSPTDYVHAALEDNATRTPEKVNIFLTKDPKQFKAKYDQDNSASTTLQYTVKRGQSILYNTFKIWRQLSLLQNSILLNRLTKSSIVRLLQVEVGDMPKEQIAPYIMQLKNKIEQKSSINQDSNMSEYTNPGPVENTVYIPTREGKGNIQLQNVGGDPDIKNIADLEYFRDQLYGSLKIPKQYFGFTDDGAGFNGGSSLSLISSRYAKTIKRIQKTLCQLITDLVNIMLLDKGLKNYVNKFAIRMQEPTTQEQKDREELISNQMSLIRDTMDLFADIEDNSVKLSILKTLLSQYANNTDICAILQDYIDKLSENNNQENEEALGDDFGDDLGGGFGGGSESFDDFESDDFTVPDSELSGAEGEDLTMETEEPEDIDLPSPSSLDQDFTQNI